MHSNATFQRRGRYLVRFGNVPHFGDFWSTVGNSGVWSERRSLARVFVTRSRAWEVCHNLGRNGVYARVVRLVPRDLKTYESGVAYALTSAIKVADDEEKHCTNDDEENGAARVYNKLVALKRALLTKRPDQGGR